MPYINVKLPGDLVTVYLRDMSTEEQVVFTYDERITEDGETRITEDGETRILDGFDIATYPEIATLKLPSNAINVSVPT